jgi:rhodanese-related sulfurtransferase
MDKKVVKLIMVALLFCFTATAWATDISMVDTHKFKEWLADKKPMILADIQKPNDFKKHHFYGAIETSAYPVKTAGDKSKLDVILRMFHKTDNDVIILGPRGGSSAQRAGNYLLEEGIPMEKLFILDGGIRNWPEQEMLLDVAGGCA